jgi:flagellar biosynthesis/type III secretory pathway protein FliH
MLDLLDNHNNYIEIGGAFILYTDHSCSLASMVLTSEADQQWLEGEVAVLEDILRDTWFYQRVLKKGYEAGIKEGIEEERKKVLQRWNQLLTIIVEVNFPSLVPLARSYIEELNDPEALQKVVVQMVSIKDVDIARSHLLTALEEKVL